MARDSQLGLHEKVVLLALDPSFDGGNAKFRSQWLGIGVAGAILYMLLRRGRLTIEANRVTMRGNLRLEGFGLDQLLRDLEAKTGPFRRPRISAWLRRTAKSKPERVVSERLVDNGILKRKRRRFSLVRPEMRVELLKSLRDTVAEGKVADEETAALAALLEAIEQHVWLGPEYDPRKMKAQAQVLGREAGPALLAVRTAVAEQKLRKSVQNVIGLVAATGVATLLARGCFD